MALSQDLVSQFAKLTSKEDKDEGVTLKGTYKKIGDIEYVQIDGSDILTPVTTTVEAETGERVNVLIKDHMATVMSNITSPSARNKSLEDLKDEVDEQGNTIKQMDNTIIQQGNSIIQINDSINQQNVVINQHDTKINQQGDEIVSLNNTVVAQGNQISTMNNTIVAQGNSIDSMNNTIKEHGDNITSINNTVTAQGNTIVSQGNTIKQHGDQIVSQGNIIESQGNVIVEHGNNINTINSTLNTQETEINTNSSSISILNTAFVIRDGILTGLSEIIVNALKTNVLNAEYAQIDFANIDIAAVETLFTKSGIINNLVTEEGHITGELVGVTIKGDLIDANTLVADKLVVLGEDGLYYKLNVTGATIESEQTNENSLNGQVIAAKSITASKISVTDLVAFGAKIGGFEITDHSINSVLKNNVDSNSEGVYLGSDGQIAIGDSSNYIKYHKDDNDNYVLDVRLNKLYLGASEKTADQYINSVVELTARSLTTSFSSSGGSNLLRNSVGYNGTAHWNHSGTIETKIQDSLSASGSEFKLIGDSSLEQIYKTIPGVEYSVSFKFKHEAIGSANTVKVVIDGQNGSEITVLDTTNTSNEWVFVSLDNPYVATTTSPKIVISCSGDDIFEITDLIISQGTNTVWSCYMDELYGKRHQLDEDGLKLYNSTAENRYASGLTSTGMQFTHQKSLDSEPEILSELSEERVLTNFGEFNQGYKIQKLRTVLLDDDNIIEYIG